MIFFGKSISLLVYKLGAVSRLPNAMIKDRTEQRLPNTAAIHTWDDGNDLGVSPGTEWEETGEEKT